MIEALHFILDSYWNTFATFLLLAVFRPVRLTFPRAAKDKENQS